MTSMTSGSSTRPPRRRSQPSLLPNVHTTTTTSITTSSTSNSPLLLLLLSLVTLLSSSTTTAFQVGSMFPSSSSSSSSSSSFFARGLIKSQVAGGGSGGATENTNTNKNNNNNNNNLPFRDNSPKKPSTTPPSTLTSRLLEEAAAASAAAKAKIAASAPAPLYSAAAATGEGGLSFATLSSSSSSFSSSSSSSTPSSLTLEAMLQHDRAAAPHLSLSVPPPPPFQQEEEVLTQLTSLFYHALNERNPDVLSKLILQEDNEMVVLSAGDGNITYGYPAAIEWLNTIRKEERKLDPSKKGLSLHPPVDISNLRVCINGLHAWVTCKETHTRGLLKEIPTPAGEFFTGTTIFRKWNGQWRLAMHWSGRLAPIQEQLSEFLAAKQAQQAQKGGGGGPGGKGGMGGQAGQQNIQRFNLRPEDFGLPPGMPLDAEAEISWEIDDDFGGEGEMEEDITIETRGGEVDGITVSSQSPGVVSGPTFQDLAGSLLEWNRNAVFRKKTKKALMAVRKLFKEGKISRVEKVKLIHSVIYATSQEEVSQVEMAYDLLVKEYKDEEEFSEQCKLILSSLGP